MERFILVSGWVTSKKDGDRHFIPAYDLVWLYKLPRGLCRLVTDTHVGWNEANVDRILREAARRGEKPIVLRPRDDGDYPVNNPNYRVYRG